MVFVHKFETANPFYTVYYGSVDPSTGKSDCSINTSNINGQRKQARRQFPIDLKEIETHYVLHADLPGYSKDQVSIDFDNIDRALHILARRDDTSEHFEGSTEEDRKKEKWLKRERPDLYVAESERYVELPKDAIAEQATANLADGVLEVHIPRQPPRRYHIQLS